MFSCACQLFLYKYMMMMMTCQAEIEHLQTWATVNNLRVRLNGDKTKEIVFSACRNRTVPPPPRPGIERVTSCERQVDVRRPRYHTAVVVYSCMLYAMHVLRARGTPATSQHDIFHATVLSRIEYASPAWSVMYSAADNARLDSLLRRSKRLGYCSDDIPAVDDLFSSADDQLFRRVILNSNHVLHPYLPDETNIPYQLRTRSHRMTLINKTKFLNDADKHSY